MPSRSADKGARFERLVRDYLRVHFGPQIARPRAGAAKDIGDIGGVPLWTLECKDRADQAAAIRIGLNDLAVEQDNAGTPHGCVVVKRKGKSSAGDQLVVMTLAALVPLIAATHELEAYRTIYGGPGVQTPFNNP